MFDYEKMSLDSKSHDVDELKHAVEMGSVIWSFDSGTSGNDDLLIYPPETSKEAIMEELEEFYEVSEDVWDQEKPNPWSLEPLSMEELHKRYPRDF